MAEPLRQTSGDTARWTALRSRAETLAAALARTPMARERPRTTASFGSHGRRRAGIGDVFWQFRRYEQTDPATAIDWRQSARSDRLFVREREEETAQTYWLWCDRSASMDYAGDRADDSKADRALVLTLAAALFFLERGERVGLIGTGRKPVSSKAALNQVQELLRGDHQADYATLPIGTGAGRILLIGDFHEQDSALTHATRLAQRRGLDGFALQVLDPDEIDFPFDGHVEFRDRESAAREDVGRAESMRDLYQVEMTRWRDKLTAITRSAGWGYLRHATDQDPLAALRATAEFIAAR